MIVTRRIRYRIAAASAAVVAAGLLTVLAFAALHANVSHAECGWSTIIPPSGDAICTTTYRDLTAVARSELMGNRQGVAAYVSSPAVVDRIMATSRRLHRLRVKSLHMAPDLELTAAGNGQVKVTLYLFGRDAQGTIGQYQVVTERVLGSRVSIVDDQPNQDW